MVIVVAYFLLWMPALLGWGVWIVWIRRQREVVAPAWDTLDVVSGMATLTAVAIILNFVMPITLAAVVVAMALGWGLFF